MKIPISKGKRKKKLKKEGDFPGGPVVKNPPSNARDAGSIPGQGTKIPHATGQLSLRATTAEFMHLNERAHLPQTTKPTRPGARTPQLQKRKPARLNERSCMPQLRPDAAKLINNFFKRHCSTG